MLSWTTIKQDDLRSFCLRVLVLNVIVTVSTKRGVHIQAAVGVHRAEGTFGLSFWDKQKDNIQ